MTKKELENLIAMGEGYTLEFKRSGTAHLGRELCAFANASGGQILIGVDDQGTIVGVSNQNRLKSSVQSTARNIDPPVTVEVTSIGDILIVTILDQYSKPYAEGGRFYLREGANCQQLSRNEIRDFYFREGVIHFDKMHCPDFKLPRDLDQARYDLFAKHAHIPPDLKHEQALRNLHLLTDEGMTNAGAWLLADDIRAYHQTATVMCGLFMGTTKVKILDSKLLAYDPYRNHREAVSYILSKINTEFIIKSPTREERPELPEKALREAVAIAHRNYRSNANIQVCVYHDRVEIVNPGGLAPSMKPEELGTKSIPRNPLLFGILHRMDIVENIGSGIKRMRRICKEYGVEEPRFEIDENWFSITFSRLVEARVGAESELGQTRLKTQTEHVPPDAGVESGVESAMAVQILKILKKEPLGKKGIAQNLGKERPSRYLNDLVKRLLEEDWLEYTIPDKPTSRLQRYRLTDKGRAWLQSRETSK